MPGPDERAWFEQAVLPHLDAAYNLARWLTRDDHDAEDVVQEAYLRAYKFFDGTSDQDRRQNIVIRGISTVARSIGQETGVAVYIDGVYTGKTGGALMNFVGLHETDEVLEESWTVKLPWEQLKSDFAGWHPAIQAIIDAADKDQCYRWSLHNRLPIANWSTARATLLGDSAHATLPYLAQGAVMAIEDGAVLMRALRQESDIAAALKLYQRNRIERTSRVVLQSTENRRRFHLRTQEAIRAEFGKVNEGAERNKWLYSYNPLTVPLV